MLLAWRAQRARALELRMIIGVALLLRLPMLFTAPSLSDDVWRYLHDGRAQRAGVSPYLYPPADERTASFRGPEHARINHPELVTIYPPGAQLAFLANALSGSHLLTWRLLLIGAELLLILALAALLRERAASLNNLVLYAWHPLAVVEIAGNGHIEPLAIALLMAGLLSVRKGRPWLAGALLGLSVAVKFVAAPIIALTAETRRARVIAAATAVIVILYSIYWSGGRVFGSLGTFAIRWEGNASVYALLAALTDGHRARILSAALLLCAAVIIHRTCADSIQRAAAFIFALLLLSPMVHPWYLLWLLAFMPLLADGWLRTAGIAWSVLVVASYAGGYAVWLEYVPVFALLGIGWLRTAPWRSWRSSAGRT
jgi:hypothetical protein